MPEGDSLYNLAEMLRPALVGEPLLAVRVKARGMYRLRPGDSIATVESRGKFLEIAVVRGLVLRTHLRMTGTWDLYEPDDRWRKPDHLARAVLEVPGAVAVCFQAPVVEIGVVGDDRLAHLGPDLCDPDVDVDAAVARTAIATPATEIGEVLLDQRIAAGIGNVYKNEALFACGVNPFTPLRLVTEEDRRALYATAATQLHANLGRWRRETIDGGLAVYDRANRACTQCSDRVRVTRSGQIGRISWWCPTCQPARA